MILKPFQRYSRIPFLCKERCTVYVTCENIDFSDALRILKRDFRGMWYVHIPPMVKIGPYRRRFTSDYVKKIRNSKFTVLRRRTSQKQVIESKDLQFSIAREFSPMSLMAKRIYTTIFLCSDPSCNWIHIIDLSNNAPDYRYSSLYAIMLYTKYIHNYAQEYLPQNVILTTVAEGKILKYIPLRVDGSEWNYARSRGIYLKLLSMARSVSTTKDISSEQISKAVDNTAEVIQKEFSDLTRDSITTLVMGSSIDEESVKDIVVNKKIDFSKIVTRTVSNVTVPDVQKSPEQFEILKNNLVPTKIAEPPPSNEIAQSVKRIIPPVSLTSYNYRSHEQQVCTQTFKKITTNFLRKNGFELTSIKVQDIPPPDNEISKTHKIRFDLELNDEHGRKHKYSFTIPKLLDDGTMLINNNKYIIPLQIKNLPITFPKPGVAKFESYTCSLMFEVLKKKFKALFVGHSFPITFFLCYIFGFRHIFDFLKIDYELSEKKEGAISIKLSGNLYLNILSTPNDVQRVMIENFLPFKNLEQIKSEPLSHEWFANIITKYYGNKYISESIMKVFSQAIDDRTMEILKDKSLPTNMFDICMYMIDGIFKKKVTPRQDIRYQRIRSYETVLNVAFDVLRKNIARYNRDVKYGNKAKLSIDPDFVLQQVITSGAIQILEQANPIEELYGFNKATYASYRGIPSDSVPEAIRSIDPSYFGNIDPIDTPEGANIGVNNSLTLGALIATKYGSIIPKRISDNVSLDILSITTSTIPFLSKNEPTRALMAANQVRQAVMIKKNEPPILQTGVESIVPDLLTTDTFLKKSKCVGKVIDVTKNEIVVRCNTGEISKVDISPTFSYSGSALNTYLTYTPVVRKGQKVSPGSILASTRMFRNMTLSMGTNALVAYVFWKGYNFEDGIVVSRSFAKGITSKHVKKLFLFVDPKDKITKVDIPSGNIPAGHVFVNVVSNRLSEIIESGFVSSQDIISRGNRFKIMSPFDGRVLRYEIYSNVPVSSLDPSIVRAFEKYNVKNGGDYVYKGKKYEGIFIYIYYEFELDASLGDKLSNRHAAKGVITRIERDNEMPVLPDGRRVDVIINPISVINRSNVGQIYELYVGEISYQLSKKITKLSRDKFIALLKQVLPLISKDYARNIIRYLSSCSKKKYEDFVKYCTTYKFPIVIPPFKEPSYKDLVSAMKILGIPERYKIKFSNGIEVSAACGYQYIYKLEHIAANKIHARSIGAYVSKTGQPTAGKSREGGQRVGEFDMWSLASYNAENIVREFFSAASDDQELKRLMYRQIIETGEASISMLRAGQHNTKTLLEKYMQSILIDLEG